MFIAKVFNICWVLAGISNPNSSCIYEIFFTVFFLGYNADMVKTRAIKVLEAQF
jgi:hypothetical protein